MARSDHPMLYSIEENRVCKTMQYEQACVSFEHSSYAVLTFAIRNVAPNPTVFMQVEDKERGHYEKRLCLEPNVNTFFLCASLLHAYPKMEESFFSISANPNSRAIAQISVNFDTGMIHCDKFKFSANLLTVDSSPSNVMVSDFFVDANAKQSVWIESVNALLQFELSVDSPHTTRESISSETKAPSALRGKKTYSGDDLQTRDNAAAKIQNFFLSSLSRSIARRRRLRNILTESMPRTKETIKNVIMSMRSEDDVKLCRQILSFMMNKNAVKMTESLCAYRGSLGCCGLAHIKKEKNGAAVHLCVECYKTRFATLE